jgi:hypothetical protein
LSHLFFQVLLCHILYEIKFINNQYHWNGLSILKRGISIDLFFPSNGRFNGVSVADICDDQSSEGPSTKQLVDAADSRVLSDQVPQLESEFRLLHLNDFH